MNLKKTKHLVLILALAIATGCKESKSYSEMLDDETNAVNWYLAQNKVERQVPPDSNFMIGKDAPFYRMNLDGTVYMRVINKGDMENRPKKGETVYIRFERYDLNKLYEGYDLTGVGNVGNMSEFPTGMNFIYGNTTLSSTTQYGLGIQVPLNYLGYNCEVELIVKSVEGFTSEISSCIPYLYKTIKYFKAEY